MGVFVHNIYIIRFGTTQIRYISFGACCHLDPSSRVVNNYQSNMSQKNVGPSPFPMDFCALIGGSTGGVVGLTLQQCTGRVAVCALCDPSVWLTALQRTIKMKLMRDFFRLGVRFGSRARSAVVGGVGSGSAHNDIVKGGLQKIYADGKIVHLHRWARTPHHRPCWGWWFCPGTRYSSHRCRPTTDTWLCGSPNGCVSNKLYKNKNKKTDKRKIRKCQVKYWSIDFVVGSLIHCLHVPIYYSSDGYYST